MTMCCTNGYRSNLEGSTVKSTGKIAQIPVGQNLGGC
jgi:hypothetical protein